MEPLQSVAWKTAMFEFIHDRHSSLHLCQKNGSFGFSIMSMLVFIPGLPQRITVIPDPDNQSAQPYWTIIDVGEWDLVDSKLLCLILQPFHRESPQNDAETDCQSTHASQVDTGWLEREARLSNYVFR
jgi:hypothetical protein